MVKIKTSVIETYLKLILRFIGDDPKREGLLETPARVRKSYAQLFSGYNQNVEDIFKTFTEGTCKEMVMLRHVEFYSTCEHHMIPFFGQISIGYIPGKKVIGISKLARIIDVFSRRLQIQERLTSQIADAIAKHLEPEGVMVVCDAQHLCMLARGVQKQNSIMTTSAIRGVFEKDKPTRNEFLQLISRR